MHMLDPYIDFCLFVCISAFRTYIARVWLSTSKRVVEKGAKINLQILYSICGLVLFAKFSETRI